MCLSEFTLASEMERLEILLAERRERIAVRAITYAVTRAIPHAAGRSLSTPAASGEITNPPACTDPGVAGTYAEDVA